jgi:predicted 3-demethylubiquinone-9 3-methyltransferase (glyoxalase superfamily)
MAMIQRLVPNLWFDKNAEEAVKFYISVFKNSKMGGISHYGKEGFEIHGMAEGTPLTIEFTIEGQKFQALNAGPAFKFNKAVSFVIYCSTQNEIDYYWNALKEGGDEKAQVCGWLKDKFGLSWQVVPDIVPAMWLSKDKEKTERLMKILMPMKKLNIATLKKRFLGIL